MNVCFIITSYIYCSSEPFENNINRSCYSVEERLEQTYMTIKSIRQYCPGAEIMLVDNGCKDPAAFLRDKVEKYLFIGKYNVARWAASYTNKGLGEAVAILYALPHVKCYDFIIKLSGRYLLNEKFDLSAWDKSAINFKHNTLILGTDFTERKNYQYGSHCTVLYGFPRKLFWKAYWRYILSLPILLTPRSVELVFPFMFRKPIYYLSEIGATGKLSVTGQSHSW